MADTINTHLARIETAKADIRASIIGKGVDVPTSVKIDAFPTYIDQITTGGGEVGGIYNKTVTTGYINLNYTAVPTTVYIGTSMPTNSIGKDGDYYIQY